MKQKLLNSFKLRATLLVAVLCAVFTGQAWADTATITFSSTTGGDSSTALSTSYFVSEGISSSDAAFGTISCSATTKCYKGKNGYGLKAGASSSAGSFTISFSTPLANVTKITLNRASYSGSKTATITVKNGSTTLANAVSTPSGSAEFSDMDITGLSIASLSGLTVETSKYCYIKSITITYSTGGSSLETSDLAITGAPVALSFDLYNNSADQTVSFTTSSTGAVTVSGGTGYVTTSVSGNTITVIPTAVTPSAQTITINQAADDTYEAGSATFTVTIDDSTPFAGGDVTFTCGTEKTSEISLTKNGVTMSFETSGGTWDRTDNYRLYAGKSLTISTASGTITNIEFTISQNNFTGEGYNNTTNTWTGNANSVTLAADGGQVRFTPVVVTVDMNATPSPSISAEDVNIAYNGTSGSISYTVNNEVTDGELTAEILSSTISNLAFGTITSSAVPFTCDANSETTAKTATIRLTYTYNTNETATKDVTVTQAAAPVAYTTIPDLFNAATTTETAVYVTFNNWVVSGVSTNGKNVFVTDNNGNGFVIYYNSDMSETFAAGKILSGTAVSCTLKKYNGFAELLNVNANDLTITTGGTVSTSNIAMASLVGVNTGVLLSYENLTCSVDNAKYYLSDGTTTLQVYNALYAFGALEAGNTYNITGIYQQYNNTKEIMPRSAADIVEVQVQHNDYNLTVTLNDNVSAIFVYSTADETNPLIVDGAAGTVQVTDGTQIKVSPDVAANYQLASLTVDGNDVTSQIDGSGAYTFTMPIHAVTITATAEASSVTPTSGATVTYDFTSTDNFLTSYPGSTHPGTGSSNAVSTFYYSNGDDFTADGTNHYFNDGYFMLGKSGATLTLPAFPFNVSKIVVHGTSNASTNVGQNIYVDDDAVSTETTGAKNAVNEYAIASDKQDAGTYILKITNAYNTQISKIEVYGYESVSVNSLGYSTFASENALDFSESGIKAFYATVGGDVLTFHEITKVPANTGVLLYKAGGTGAEAVNVPVFTGTADAVTGNVFVKGAGEAVSYAANDQNYILFNGEDGLGFYQANNNTVATNRAYIHINGTGVKSFFAINFDAIVDGIKTIDNSQEPMANGQIYNLAGQRMSKMQKGINIVNGKKVLVK